MSKTKTKDLIWASAMALALAAGGAGCKKAQAKTQGVGDSLRAFIIKNCETGERYCQVCTYGGKPTIMTVADIDDPGIEKDLAAIQKIVAENDGKSLTAFALFGKVRAGKFTPVEDDDAAVKKLDALRAKLELTYPVTIVPSTYTEKESKGYASFVAQYNVPKSRTVMLAAADNKVVFADVFTGEDKKYEALSAAVQSKL